MSNEASPKCPQCGAPLKESAPAGLCPNCLMALNLRTETVFTGDRPAAQPALPPEQIAPHFPQLEILECLGRGGMGVVYKARQKSLNRVVALKLLAPERVSDAKFAGRFAREAQALAALNHPNIVTIYDFGQAGGFYYLLMEYVDGVNLRQLLRARKFTPEEALAIVPPLCDALQFAHDRGIVHRDIKPENLLLDKSGRVKVADFGIAKMIEPEAGGADLPVSPEIGAAQQHGATNVVGTPGYSAPEQKTDPQRVDSRADIYSLGVVFYEMLTGQLPGKPIEPPSRKVQIDVRLDEVVLRALENNPDLRYQQVSEVKTMVETIVETPLGGSRREEAQNEIGKQKVESGRTSESLVSTMVKSERARLAVQQFSGARVEFPVMGEVALYTDRLVISSGNNQHSIPLADIHELGVAVMPFWISPGPFRYATVDFDEAGQRRRLIFLAGSSMFRRPDDTRLHAAEWLTAIQREMKSGIGRDLPIAAAPTVVPVRVWRSLIWLPVAFLAAAPLIAGLLSKRGLGSLSLINAALMSVAFALMPAVTLFIVFVIRSCSLRGTVKRPLGFATGSAVKMPVGKWRATAASKPRGWKFAFWVTLGAMLLTVSIVTKRAQPPSVVITVGASSAQKGDIGVYIAAIGTVESSNSVVFSISEDYVQEVVKKFDAKQPLTIEAYDRKGEKFGHGSLSGVDNQIDAPTGTLKCRANVIPEGGNLMVPGLFLNIRMLLEIKHGVILVPAEAIQRDPQGAFVWVIKPDQTVSRCHVTISAEEGQTAGIQAGLSPEELVVISGFDQLKEGRTVRYTLVQNQEATAAKAERLTSPPAPSEAHNPNPSFSPVIERTLCSDGKECDFLVLRTGEVLRRSLVAEDLYGTETPFFQWLRENGVDIGLRASTNKSYGPFGRPGWEDNIISTPPPNQAGSFGVITFGMGVDWFPYFIPDTNGGPVALVGVTNIWNDLPAAQFHGPPGSYAPAAFLKEKHEMCFFPGTNFSQPIAFSTRKGIEGLLQITGFTDNPPGVKIRYKLVQNPYSPASANPIPAKPSR